LGTEPGQDRLLTRLEATVHGVTAVQDAVGPRAVVR